MERQIQEGLSSFPNREFRKEIKKIFSIFPIHLSWVLILFAKRQKGFVAELHTPAPVGTGRFLECGADPNSVLRTLSWAPQGAARGLWASKTVRKISKKGKKSP